MYTRRNKLFSKLSSTFLRKWCKCLSIMSFNYYVHVFIILQCYDMNNNNTKCVNDFKEKTFTDQFCKRSST